MQTIGDLLDQAAKLHVELVDTHKAIMAIIGEQAVESAALALTSAAMALRKAEHATHMRDSTRKEIRSSRRLVESQLGWSAE